MEMQLNYCSLLSLEKMVLKKMAVVLWNQRDVLAQFEVCSDSDSFDSELYYRVSSLSALEEGIKLVTNKLSKLMLPSILFKKFIPVIRWIGVQIQEWQHFHIDFLIQPPAKFERRNFIYSDVDIGTRILEKLCWTPSGTINYRKTAEELIRQEILHFFPLYRLACLFFLEDYIPLLFQKLPREFQVGLCDDIYRDRQSLLDAFWFKYICEEDTVVRCMSAKFNFFPHAFKKSAVTGNKAALDYFCQKLSHEEKTVLIRTTAMEILKINNLYLDSSAFELPEKNLADVLSYLLSQMSPEEQMDLFKMHPTCVLGYFVEWSWHDLFFEIAELTWDFLSLDDYYNILEVIKDDMFPDLFLRSPEKLKKLFLDKECLDGAYLLERFNSLNIEGFTLFFRNVDTASKVRLAFSDQVIRIYLDLIRHNEWNSLEIIISEAILSKTEREILKDIMMINFSEIYEGKEYINKILQWEQLFQNVDESVGRAASNSRKDENMQKRSILQN